jgi:hypothetical protein
MINPKDISPGNIILLKEQKVEVVSVDKYGYVTLEHHTNRKKVETNLSNELIRPIRTTKARLNKLGFVDVEPRAGIQKAFKKRGVRINQSNTGHFYFNNRIVNEFHILQNIYRLIEGSEIDEH